MRGHTPLEVTNTKCPICGEPIENPDMAVHIPYDTTVIPRKPKYRDTFLHERCFSDNLDNPIGSIIYHTPDKEVTISVTPIFLYSVGFDVLPDDVRKTILELAESIEWHPTDDWRGFYEFKTPAEWNKVASDWVPPFGGDPIGDRQILKHGEERHKIEKDEYIAVYMRTSNVFSTTYDFFVRDKS